MDVVREGTYVLTVTDGGYAKRTRVEAWQPKGRGILGVTAMRLVDVRGSLVGALVVDDDDEVFAIKASGEVIRTPASQISVTGRVTMGVTLTSVGTGDSVVAVARNAERVVDDEVEDVPTPDGGPQEESSQ